MSVQEVMTREIACCPPDAKLTEVARLMVDHDCGAIPVVESQSSKKLVGIVTDRDIVRRTVAEGKNPLEMTAESCMSTSVVSAAPDASLEECSDLMEEHQIRRIPVVDDKGICCGVVSQADVARKGSDRMTSEVVKKVSQPTQEASRT
ncbi:MAG: CBS domain-containing protein [Pirellulales bacterium]